MDIRYFLGANSAKGFVSHYDQILPRERRRLIRILKGGAGCGKSTLMKRAAAHAERLGLAVERIPCSGDPGSLDGIAVPEIGYAIVDGTAPHVVEPQLCGCVEAYLDLGRGYDLRKLSEIQPVLREIQAEKQACYPKATACLQAAAALMPLLPSGDGLSEPLLQSICESELPILGKKGTSRILFLSGFSPEGRVFFPETVQHFCHRIYVLSDAPDAVSRFLRTLLHTAVSRGWDCLVGDSPLLPGAHPEQLLIPERSLAFVSENSNLSFTAETLIRIGTSRRDAAAELQEQLCAEAAVHLRRAGEYHRLLEKACIPFYDFSVADQATADCRADIDRLSE